MKLIKKQIFDDYLKYGGLPQVFLQNSSERKKTLLNNNFNLVYLKDVVERNNIKNDKSIIDYVLKFLSSSIGSFINPLKIANTFKSSLNINISSKTIKNYLNIMNDAFIIAKAEKSNINRRKYIGSSTKFYFEDIGIRNSIIYFKKFDESHLFENIIYNELIRRGFHVSIGVIEIFRKNQNNKNERITYEIDFIAQKFDKKFYIQSCLYFDAENVIERETRCLKKLKMHIKK